MGQKKATEGHAGLKEKKVLEGLAICFLVVSSEESCKVLLAICGRTNGIENGIGVTSNKGPRDSKVITTGGEEKLPVGGTDSLGLIAVGNGILGRQGRIFLSQEKVVSSSSGPSAGQGGCSSILTVSFGTLKEKSNSAISTVGGTRAIGTGLAKVGGSVKKVTNFRSPKGCYTASPHGIVN